jgi:restriction system protein
MAGVKYSCGQCEHVLLESISPEQPRFVPDACPKCGSNRRSVTVMPIPPGPPLNVMLRLVEKATVTLPPDLLLQAVVVRLGPKTNEGDLIEAVEPAWFELAKLIEADPSAMHKIHHRKWEEIIAGWYENRGFKVTLTPRSADLGRDVIAEKTGVLCIKIIDQVKAYGPDRRVTANDVRALLGVLNSDHSASKGLVTTTSKFAPGIIDDKFIKPYIPTRLELVDGEELMKRLGDIIGSSFHTSG